MQLKNVSVRSLFGRFDHDIPINLDENITIITAPNGYGKTVLLNLVTLFLTSQFYRMLRYDFEVLEITFKDNSKIRISQSEHITHKDGSGNKKDELCVEPINISGGAKIWNYKSYSDQIVRRTIVGIERFFPFIERIGRDEWIDETTGETYSAVEAVEKFSDHLPGGYPRGAAKVPKWLREVLRCSECHLIETQSLAEKEPFCFKALPSS